jgi:hypothetical protein
VDVAVDPAVESMVRGWPVTWGTERAEAIGLPRDEDAASIVRAYLARIGR